MAAHNTTSCSNTSIHQWWKCSFRLLRSPRVTKPRIFRKFPGRFISVHLQDYAPDDHKKEVIMGEGIVHWKDFFAAARVGGVTYIFVEMESNPAIMQGRANFLKNLG
jgi:hypothetical protein